MATSVPKPAQLIITLEDDALIADIKKALKLIRGVTSVRVATLNDDKTITPAMRRSINKARRERRTAVRLSQKFSLFTTLNFALGYVLANESFPSHKHCHHDGD